MALDLVVARGALKEVEGFVRMLEEVDGKDFRRLGTPLHTAARQCHGKILPFLLHRGWKCGTYRNSSGRTPVYEAVSSSFLKGVESLLVHTNNCDVNTVGN